MNLRGSIVLLLLFLIYFGKTAHCPRNTPDRCGSSWLDANAKCGQCCKRSNHCTDDPNDTGCWSGLSETPCDGSNAPTAAPTTSNPTTASPTTSDPTTATPTTATPTTATPTTATPTPTTASPTAAPIAPTTKTPTTASPTAAPIAPTTAPPTTPSPTTASPTTASPTTSDPTTAPPTAPTTATPICTSRCGSSWGEAYAKCGQCCNYPSDCTIDPADTNCWADLSTTPCTMATPTTSPTFPSTAPTQAPTMPPVTAQPSLPPTTSSPTTASPTTSDPTTATPTTAIPTTASPTAAPIAPTTATPTTASPTAAPIAPTTKTPTTASPTTSDPTTSPPTAPTTATPICTSRCGSSWGEAYAKCGQCCNYPSDCTIDPADTNCWADLSTTPCTMATPTTSPTSPSTAPTQAPTMPTMPPVTAQPSLSPTTAQPTQSTSSPTNGPTRDSPMNVVGDYRISSISGCGSGKYVSLSFDDGPANGADDETQTIIDKLSARGIVATFYVSPASWGGDQWSLDQRCPLFQALNDAGMEIQSHSWSHPDFAVTALSNAAIFEELERTREEIVRCGGAEPTVFRPPYGSLSKAQAEYIVELGYIVALWNLDSNDWRSPNDFAQISSYLDLSAYGGDSVNILMHDRDVYAVLDDILDVFVADGYEFITASECFANCDTMDSDGVCVDMHGNDYYVIDSWR